MMTSHASDESLGEWVALLTAFKDSATPAMAERLGTLFTSLGELSQRATSTEALSAVDSLIDNQTAVDSALKQLTLWQNEGTLDALAEIATLATAVKRSATAPMVERLGQLLAQFGPMLSRASEQDVQDAINYVLDNQQYLLVALKQLGTWQTDGTWDALAEIATLATAVKRSATAPMVERLGQLLAQFGPMLSRASEQDAQDAINYVLDNQQYLLVALKQLGTWQTDGTWDALIETTALVRALKDSLSPAIIERLAMNGQDALRLLNRTLDDGLLDLGLGVASALSEAFGEAKHDTQRVTIGSMFRIIKEPNVQLSLKTIFGVLRKLPSVLDKL